MIQKISPQNVQQNKYSKVPKEYLEVANGMEAQFINHMLDELDKTVQPTEPDSSATKYYKSLVNNERANIMAATENGLGIKDLVLKQIYPQFNKNLNKDIQSYENVKNMNNNIQSSQTGGKI